MNRIVTFVSEFDNERDAKRGIIKKSLQLSWEYSSLIIGVAEHFSTEVYPECKAMVFSKSWDLDLHTIISIKSTGKVNPATRTYYPQNVDPGNMRMMLDMANTCDTKLAESAMYSAFYQLEIFPAFYGRKDKFEEGWLKEHLPSFWEYWARKVLSEREYKAREVMDE